VDKLLRKKSFTLLGCDGNHLTLSETLDREAIVVSIQQNDDKGRIATMRLNAAQFELLCSMDSTYDGLTVKTAVEPPAEPPELASAETVAALKETL
jgi:hypothetical protein